MAAPVHFRVEVFYETLDGPACGYQARGRLTEDPAEVTCRKCLTLCGFDAVPESQLTAAEGDPIRRAA